MSKETSKAKETETKPENESVYPTWRYHEKHALEGVIVNSPEEEKALGKGWVASPADLAKKEPKE